MNRNSVVLASALLGLGSLVLTGQPVTAVFTSAQADAGRTAYENSCGRCHTPTLLGRKGEAGEVPPLASLPASFQKFIGPAGRVPPLMGKTFVVKYGQKTMAEMYTLFRGAADTTPVADLHMSDDTLVNITAYILQKNGARPGSRPLEKTASALFGSVAE